MTKPKPPFVVVMTLLAALSALTVGRPVPAGAVGTGCPQYTAIIAPGTWETNQSADPHQPVGMLKPLGDGLEAALGNQVEVLYAPYAASAFDQGLSYAQSKATLDDKLLQLVSSMCSTSQLVLAGYSQGADGIGDLAHQIGCNNTPIPNSRVAAVGLLSDPKRDPSTTNQVGAQAPGHGLAGTREGGFCGLTSKVRTACAPGDMYCGVDSGAAPLVSAIGQALSGSGETPEAQALESTMTGDFTSADAGVGQTVSTLTDRATSLPEGASIGSIDMAADVAGIGSGAHAVNGTLKPLADVQKFVEANPTVLDALRSAPGDSPEAAATRILDAIKTVDLSAAIDTATSLATTAQQILSATTSTSSPAAVQPGTSTATSPRDALTPAATKLQAQTAPLGGLDMSTLSNGLGILKVLKPNTIISQVTNAVTGVAETAANIPRIIDGFIQLPQKIAVGDIHGAHAIAGQLNNDFAPIVKAAAGVDLQWISSIVSMASVFDPSGTAAIAAMIIGLLGNVDVIRIANDVGQAQEVCWRAVEALARGDLLGAGAQMTGLLPVGIDLAAAVVGSLTGGGTKTDPSQLGQTSTSAAAMTSAVGSGDLAGLAGQLVDMAGSDSVAQLIDVAKQGADVATFYASNVHTSYGADGSVQMLLDFILGQIT